MIALLGLYRQTLEPTYLSTARTLGQFIHTFRSNSGQDQGFLAGINDPETVAPTHRIYASTEHNLDVVAAFTALFRITGEAQWQDDAVHARTFVEAMWDGSSDAFNGCFLAGTTGQDMLNTQPKQLPEDVQAWSVLALPDTLVTSPFFQVLNCAERHHRTSKDGFCGFDFNNDNDGVWFEGTAHMAVAYAAAGEDGKVEALRQQLITAQYTAPFGDDFGLAAASHDRVSSGFDFVLFRRLHVGATAWNVFAQRKINPYYMTPLAPGPQLSLIVSKSIFVNGDQLTLKARATPGPISVTADVYIALQIPQSPGCISFNCMAFLAADMTFTTSPTPFKRTRIPFDEQQLFVYTFDQMQMVPVGDYVWLGALVAPGTVNLIGDIGRAPFGFKPGDH
jgi:hypothetical protein